MVAIIGDVHGRFEDLFRIIQDNSTVSHFFQVGDLGGTGISYPDLPSNFHFIKGNHENWKALPDLIKKPGLYLKNGVMYSFVDTSGKKEVPFTVGVLGGNYSPNFYTKKRSELEGSRKRHFVEDDTLDLMSLEVPCDILLTHEAPSPFIPRGRDIGQPLISEIIKTNQPGIHFFGHHHILKSSMVHGVRSMGLAYAGQSYVLYDVASKKITPVIKRS